MTGVLVVGDVINDVVVRASGPPEPDTDNEAAITAVLGGSGANQAAWLATLGVHARLAARVGANDAHRHRTALAALGVDARLGEDRELSTGSIVILVDGDGDRTMFTDRGANRKLAPHDLDPDLLADMGHLHVSGYSLLDPEPRAAVSRLWTEAGASGCTRSCDPGSAGFLSQLGPQIFLSAIGGADVLFPNRAEAAVLTQTDDAERAARLLAEAFPVIVVKDGAGGVLVAVGRDIYAVPAPTVEVVDPTGAGDAFAAGFLAAWLAGADPEAAAGAGVRTAVDALQQVGGRPARTTDPRPVVAPWSQLRAAALAATGHAYAPWSGLAVGAAGLTDDGRIISAANVENASYGLTLCAECGVVSGLRAAGATRLVAIAVVGRDGEPMTPCGRCRQVLWDNGGPDLLVDAGPGREPTRLDALLPNAFDGTAVTERRER